MRHRTRTGTRLAGREQKIMHPWRPLQVVIEPMLTDQWFVDAQDVGQPAIERPCEGRTNFVPKNWEKTYFEWMENIEPWCISRQLWWGHQIPVWYGFGDKDIQSSLETAKTVLNGQNVRVYRSKDPRPDEITHSQE